MGEIKEKMNFRPEDIEIYVQPVMRPRNAMISDPEHEAYFLFGNATIDYSLPLDRQGNLVNPFTEPGEQEWLEAQLDLDLNIYKNKDNYWKKFKVKLGKDKKVLNLGNPKHYIEYLVLKANKMFIAPSGDKAKDRATYRYCLVTKDYESQATASKVNRKIDAYKALGKMEDNPAAMVDFLKVYGKRVDKNSKREFLVAEINRIVEEDTETFIKLWEDRENYEMRLLIARAVDCGAIEKSGRKYSLPGGDPLSFEGTPATILNVIEYLKSPKNQDILVNIEARVNAAKE
jgi:hypothetical protein